ncbi:MAG TPA: ferritin-like domain-containing protein [Kribbella sp.]|uniref:ferritin-like domain-containing protein n=1 Tax=Kribbella sp. TaxID=1871183 RepID=UPI002D7A1AAC|nr:ferritin-like domain-containing protein [Kribbella sp.]HET6297452.1 ferritin-like domain-containing protein [Kribbella sp.]
MGGTTFDGWLRGFEDAAELRARESSPPWQAGGVLDRAMVRSVQKFQAGEDGDGASLIGKSARVGDPAYAAAVRLFVAEEQNHARLLEQLLLNAGASTIDGHWSDKVFVSVRRALGLRLELMTLMVAEVVALRYYEALRDGTEDPVLTEVAARILADEERHVPFHVHRLRGGFAHVPRPARLAAAAGWWILMLGAVGVVAVDHGPALRHLGVRPLQFMADTVQLFRPIAAEVLR